ncbi:DUF2958 domain-containing protein [Novosphingobium olei]|uniref:DUF2958 domain-containing protein n=1 Tax=Novosphingobium olei TaxID=2728851 RepID=A0A7Y0BT93_9SPHN|nr:DUF2958 domain-containing protein [Novosphingobium olei]NML96146.1 DUF2958 domain-containing protein [Novosphingobium olei]
MILLPPSIRLALRTNDAARRVAVRSEQVEPDPLPVLKLFNPIGAATWLATELFEDGDTLFGLADLGFGCPELGCFSLSEIGSVRLPFGLCIERDEGFVGLAPLSRWAALAREGGSILAAQRTLRRQSHELPSGLPPEGAQDDG